jgi:hypothetical protein
VVSAKSEAGSARNAVSVQNVAANAVSVQSVVNAKNAVASEASAVVAADVGGIASVNSSANRNSSVKV